MVKDKVIQMEDGKNYYVLEEVEYLNRKFLLSLECDLDKDTINEEDYLVMELVLENNDLVIKRVLDENITKTVVVMLLQKIRNS